MSNATVYRQATMREHEQARLNEAFLAWCAEAGNVVYTATADELRDAALENHDTEGE